MRRRAACGSRWARTRSRSRGLAVLWIALAAVVWGTWGDLDSDTGYDVVAGALVADGRAPVHRLRLLLRPARPAPRRPLLCGRRTRDRDDRRPRPRDHRGHRRGHVRAGADVRRPARRVPGRGADDRGRIHAEQLLVRRSRTRVAATLGTLFLLVLLLCLRQLGARETIQWAAAAGTALGLLALTKPEPALAGVAAAAAWLLVRRWSGRSVRRDAIALIGIGVGDSRGRVRRVPLVRLAAPALLREPLSGPTRSRAAATCSSAPGCRSPSRASSRSAGGRSSTRSASRVILGVARLAERPGRSRRIAWGLVVAGGLLAVAAALVNPEALRHGLQFVYGWVPVGAAVAAVVLLVRARRAPSSETGLVRVAGAVALAVVAATAYNGFFLHAPRPQMAVYYAPLVAVFLVHLHLRTLAKNRAAVTIGAAWLAFLVAAGVGLTLKDASAESSVVRGDNGSLAETPAAATHVRGRDRVDRAGDRAGRAHSRPAAPDWPRGAAPGALRLCRRSRCCRASSNGPNGERDAIARPRGEPGAAGRHGRPDVAGIRTGSVRRRLRPRARGLDRTQLRARRDGFGGTTADPRTLTIWRRAGE